MLIANDGNGNVINLFDIYRKKEQFKVRELGPFFCPICKKEVLYKCGLQKIPHFAHITLGECSNERKESKEHYEGKYDLYHFFKDADMDVTIEKNIQSINQRPDLMIKNGDELLCIEYQCSKIPLQQIIDRTESYKKANINILWILGDQFIQQRKSFSFNLDALSIFCFIKINGYSLIFYYPSIQSFIVLSSLVSFSSVQYIGKKDIIPIKSCSLKEMISQEKINKELFVNSWCKLKKQFRMYQNLYSKGNFYEFRKLTYLAKVDYFPSVIGIPLKGNFILKEHSIMWQGVLFFKFFYFTKIGESVCMYQILKFVNEKVCTKKWRTNRFQNSDFGNLENCVENYIEFLDKIRIVKRMKNGKIMKIAHVIIPISFQQALDEDFRVTNTAFDLLFQT